MPNKVIHKLYTFLTGLLDYAASLWYNIRMGRIVRYCVTYDARVKPNIWLIAGLIVLTHWLAGVI